MTRARHMPWTFGQHTLDVWMTHHVGVMIQHAYTLQFKKLHPSYFFNNWDHKWTKFNRCRYTSAWRTIT